MRQENIIDVENSIIQAAREVFVEKGIVRSEMKDIAVRAGVSRATLYRHFPGKESILFVLANKGVQKIFSSIIVPEHMESSFGNGLEKVEWQLTSFVRVMYMHPDEIMFLRDFDVYYTHDYPVIAESANYEKSLQGGDHSKALLKSIYEGIADGSIRDLDNPELTVKSILNSCFGMAQRIIPRESHYIIENGYGKEQVNVLVRLLLQSLRTK